MSSNATPSLLRADLTPNDWIFFRVAMVNVVLPLRADVFAVTEFGTEIQSRQVFEGLSSFGDHLKAFGVTANDLGAGSPSFSASSVETEHVRVVPLAGPAVSTLIPQDHWFKLHEAWKLMEFAEAEAGAEYDLVVKLRFDATPLNVLNVCGGSSDAMTTTSFRALHGKPFNFNT